jgi:hypothetical protein
MRIGLKRFFEIDISTGKTSGFKKTTTDLYLDYH